MSESLTNGDDFPLSFLKRKRKSSSTVLVRLETDEPASAAFHTSTSAIGATRQNICLPTEIPIKRSQTNNYTLCSAFDDHDIDAAEAQLMAALDDQILEAEFAEILDLTWKRLKAAVIRYKAPGGLAQNMISPMEEMTPEQILLDRDFSYREAVRASEISASWKQKVPKIMKRFGPFNIDYMGNSEFCVTKELPKYIGDTHELLLTEEEVSRTLLRRLSSAGISGEVHVFDKVGDPYTVVIKIYGDRKGVDKAKKCLEFVVRRKQMRFVSCHATPPLVQSSKTADRRKLELYLTFSVKFEKVRDIDFGGIHGKSFTSSIWQQHKKRFGHACSPTCRCLLELPYLTSTVIDDVIKKGKSSERPPEIGFCKRFAPKFVGLLQEEFPNETNESLLNRLIRMWESHLKQQRFGTSCRKTCPCLEGWVKVFLKGRAGEPLENLHPTTSSSSASSRQPVVTTSTFVSTPKLSPQSQSEYDIDFNTKDPLGFFAVTKSTNRGSVCSIFSVSPNVKDVRLSPGTIVVALAMGKVGSQWHSVSTHDELRRCYFRFRQHPEGQWMRIRFINTEVKPESDRSRTLFWSSNFAWQGNARVQGWAGGAPEKTESITKAASTHMVFCSGGAAAHIAPSQITSETSLLAPLAAHVPSSQTISEASLLSSSHTEGAHAGIVDKVAPSPPNVNDMKGFSRLDAESNDQVQIGLRSDRLKTFHRREPGHRVLPIPRSIFKARTITLQQQPAEPAQSLFRTLARSVKRNKPVVLSWASDSNIEDSVVYDTTANAADGFGPLLECHKEASPSKDDAQVPHSLKTSPNNAELESAISLKTCSDVLKLLQEGADTTPEDVNSKEIPETLAKRIRDSLREKMKHNPTQELATQYNEMILKVNLLKIFGNCKTCISKSAYVTKWAKYEAKIDTVENLHLTSTTPVSTYDKFFCEVKVEGEIVGSRLQADWAESIVWPELQVRRFKYLYNDSLPDRYRTGKRNFIVSIGKTMGSAQRTVELASKFLQLDEIKSAVTATDNSTLKVEMPRTSSLESGLVVITFRKLRVETTTMIAKERGRLRATLRQVVNDIKQFNADKRRESVGMSQLDFNLQLHEPPRNTLLHTAVYLHDDHLVKELITLGADTNVRNEKGVSPRALAISMCEMSSKGGKAIEIETLRAILDILGVVDDGQSKDDDNDLDTSRAPSETGTMPTDGVKAVVLAPQHVKKVLLSSGEEVKTSDELSEDAAVHPYDQHDVGVMVGETSVQETSEQVFETQTEDCMAAKDTSDEIPNSQISKESSKGTMDWQIAMHDHQDAHSDALPTMTIEDLLPGRRLCKFYGSIRGCGRGRSCVFIHLHPINASDLKIMEERPRYQPKDVLVKRVNGRFGQSCFTAMFWDSDANVFLKAVGGKTLGANRDGLNWYRSYHDAVEGIERVIVHWRHTCMTEPVSAISGVALTRQGNQPIGITHQHETKVFYALQDSNLGNLFHQIAYPPQPLPKNAWTYRHHPEDRNFLNASFTAQFNPDLPSVTFTSQEIIGDGSKCLNGVHYHSTVNKAKASAFLQLLKFAQSKGVIASLTSRSDGKPLVLGRM